MTKIVRVRPVLLSAPYSNARDDLEVICHLPSGCRTTGMVEITLADGAVGLGEGYLAVFAPRVFEQIVHLIAPVLIGRDSQDFTQLYRDIRLVTGYWSLQGAAQHVVSAIEIALQDCRAQQAGVPVWRLLGGPKAASLKLYASGGDAVGPEPMGRELDRIQALGIEVVKIRARNHQVDKTLWCQRHAAERRIAVAVDMTQNLAIPSQSVDQIIQYLDKVIQGGGTPPVFLEEALGPHEFANYPALRKRVADTRIAGGEIVTTSSELCERIAGGWYDIAQPDATVIGGICATLEVFAAAAKHNTDIYVHCWGGSVGMMANYHAALAGGGTVAEWPIKSYELRDALLSVPWKVEDGRITLPETPGLGVRLSADVEREYPFRDDAVYHCLVSPRPLPPADWR